MTRVCTETQNLFREISVIFGKFREILVNFAQEEIVIFLGFSHFSSIINKNQLHNSQEVLYANCSKLQSNLVKFWEIVCFHVQSYTKFRETFDWN